MKKIKIIDGNIKVEFNINNDINIKWDGNKMNISFIAEATDKFIMTKKENYDCWPVKLKKFLLRQ